MDMKNIILVMIMVAAFSLPAMAGWNNQEQQNVTLQQEAFQSTSTMQGSGSAYTSNPTLNSDGSASSPSESAPASNKIRKSFGDNTDGGTTSDPNSPIGDAALPLLVFAAAAAATVAIRNRRRQVAK